MNLPGPPHSRGSAFHAFPSSKTTLKLQIFKGGSRAVAAQQSLIHVFPSTYLHRRLQCMRCRTTHQCVQAVNKAQTSSGLLWQILVSQDHQTVGIYSHYPITRGNQTTFYYHLIKRIDLKRICSVIDTLQSEVVESVFHGNWEVIISPRTKAGCCIYTRGS